MVPGDLVYTGDRKNFNRVPIPFNLEGDEFTTFIRRVRHVEVGMPGILLETTHLCKVLTRLGVILISSHYLVTPEEYQECMEAAKRTKFEIKPMTAPMGSIFYLSSSYGSK